MRFTRKRLIAATATVAVVAAGTGATFAVAGGEDGEGAAKGPGADRARAAALEIVEGGEANSVERDGENGATWEVEVTRSDGGTVDVRLDDRYKLVVVEGDSEDAGEAAESGG